MIRVSVVSTKDLFKRSFKILIISIILIILVCIIKFSQRKLCNIELDVGKCISCIAEEITVMDSGNENKILSFEPEDILDSQLIATKMISSRKSISNEDEEESSKGQQDVSNSQENVSVNSNNMSEPDTNVTTQVLKSAYKETYNTKIDGVRIKNETSFNLEAEQIKTEDVKLNNKNVIIFHTHTCESYTPTDNNQYIASGNYRTTDLAHSVSKVGDVLQNYLTGYGFKVVHDKTYHDYPSYTGSYGRSLKTVSNILSKNKDTDIIIDLHRDAMGDESYAPKVKIGDEYVAQIMFVIGTNGSGLQHDNWKQNLEFAIKLQKKADEMYPGLFKPIILRNARYNQNLSSAATIMEFGATGNTLEECELSAKYLAKVIEELF